ncbi:MAG: hypothetical protein U9Q24_04860 [Candidatus Ratteibacteria bacterium]|nr:hypothetical protein [Candidatus Ratteibacteria bacterium]
MKLKKILTRECPIIIALIFVASICLILGHLQSKKFSSDGYRYLSDKDIQRYNLFILGKRQKLRKFALLSAIPVNSFLTREDFKKLAKRELLNRKGFGNFEWAIVWNDELEKRFGKTTGEEVDNYFEERKQLTEKMRNWSDKHLAARAEISLGHFSNSINEIAHLKKKINFSLIPIFLFVCVYPIYLLISFTVWAIKTLKKEHLQKILQWFVKNTDLILKWALIILIISIVIFGWTIKSKRINKEKKRWGVVKQGDEIVLKVKRETE